MRRLLACIVLGLTLVGGGVADSRSPLDPDELAVARSTAVQRLAHGARLARYRVAWSTTCEVGITVTLSRRVPIDDDIPVTDAPLRAECLPPRRRLVYHLVARGVLSIAVTLDRRTHRILYIRPTWDADGATRISQQWVGSEPPFPPTGD